MSRAGIVKLTVLMCVVALCLTALHFTPLNRHLTDVQELKAALRASGALAPIVFIAGAAALMAIGCPRLFLCALGGAAFGFVRGLLWSQIGTLLGSYLTFLFARWAGREAVARLSARFSRLDRPLDSHSLVTVFLFRQLPIGSVFTNLALGLTRTRHDVFLAGSALGFLTEAVPVTLVGSSLGKESAGESLRFLIMGLAVFFLLVLAGVKLHRSVGSRRDRAAALSRLEDAAESPAEDERDEGDGRGDGSSGKSEGEHGARRARR